MYYKTILFLVFTFSFNQISGQDLTKNGTPINQRFGFSIAYYGFKTKYTGVQLGFENYLATTKNHQIVGGVYLDFYNQKNKQKGTRLNARIGQRYVANFGLMLESYIGIGAEYTTYTSRVYDFSTSPSIIVNTKTSKFGISPNIALGLGYDFSRTTNLPVTYFIRPNINWLVPDKNLVFQTSLNLETGLVYRPTF